MTTTEESKRVITLDQLGTAIGHAAWRRLKKGSRRQEPYTILLEELQRIVAQDILNDDLKRAMDDAYWESSWGTRTDLAPSLPSGAYHSELEQERLRND